MMRRVATRALLRKSRVAQHLQQLELRIPVTDALAGIYIAGSIARAQADSRPQCSTTALGAIQVSSINTAADESGAAWQAVLELSTSSSNSSEVQKAATTHASATDVAFSVTTEQVDSPGQLLSTDLLWELWAGDPDDSSVEQDGPRAPALNVSASGNGEGAGAPGSVSSSPTTAAPSTDSSPAAADFSSNGAVANLASAPTALSAGSMASTDTGSVDPTTTSLQGEPSASTSSDPASSPALVPGSPMGGIPPIGLPWPGDGAQAASGPGWTPPLWVLDAKDAIVLVPGVTEHEWSTWTVDLRAQVSGKIVTNYNWNLTQAADATNVIGQGTYRLQFNWASFQGAARTNTITLTATFSDSTQQSQVLTFRVQATDGTGQAPPAPTTFATWPNVLAPDRIDPDQGLIPAHYLALSAATGGVYSSHTMPGYNPLVEPVRLEYSSLAADPRPIFIDHYELDPTRAATPARVSAKLTLNGIVGSEVWYDTSLLNPGDIMQIALQGDATALATGRYNYQLDITAHYTPTVTTTHSGQVSIINYDTSQVGDGWSIAGIHRIHAVTGGVILDLGAGLSLWYADGAQQGTYVTPAGDFSTLIRNANSTYTRTLSDGVQINFDTSGRQTSIVDRNGNSQSYAWDVNSKLNTITDRNGQTVTLAHNGSNLVSSFTDPAGRPTLLSYDATARLTGIVQPDPDAGGPLVAPSWGFQYDVADRMTSLADPRNNSTGAAYDFAGRAATVTRPDATTQQLTAMVLRGLAAPGTGTSTSNPAPSMLAVEAQAVFTDGRGNDWSRRLDWLGFGLTTQLATPLEHNSVAHRNQHGLPWLASDPLNRRTYAEFDALGNTTKILVPDDNQLLWQYNAYSQPTVFTDARAYNTQYTYGATGNLTKIKDALNFEQNFSYSTDGLLTQSADQLGFATSFQFDTLDRMTRITWPDGDGDPNNNPFTALAYDTAGNLTQLTDERGYATATVFDALGRPTQRTLPDGDGDPNNNPKYVTVYDGVGNATSVTDPLNHVRSYSFDTLNRLASESDALNNSTTYGYDAGDNLTLTTRPLSRTVALGYDASGRNTSLTLNDPDGVGPLLAPVYTFAVDAAGQRTGVTDPLNRTTTTAFQSRGWVSSVTDPLGNVSGRSFDANGNVTGNSQSGPGFPGINRGYTYDALNRRTRYTDEMSQNTDYAFDAAGQMTSVTDALGHTSNLTYTPRGWLATQQSPDPDGAGPLTAPLTTFAHDVAGNRTGVTDPLNLTTTRHFDAQNRAYRATDPRGAVTQVAFDLAGRQVSVTDPVNNVTSWGYDAADRATSETNPWGQSRTFVWNAAGDLTSSADRNGRQRQRTYDNIGRLKSEQWISGGQTLNTINYVWDAASQLTSAGDGVSAYAFGYDLAGRVTSENNSGTPGMANVLLTHGYNAAGSRTSRSDNLGGSTTFTRDASQRMTGATLTAGALSAQVGLVYDAVHRVARINRGGVGMQVSTDYSFDNMDRATRIQHKNPMGQVLSTLDYTYTASSEVASYTGPEGTLNYSYDTAGELTAVSGARVENYSYDLNGNRTMSGYQTTTGNRLTTDGAFNYTWDNEGNLLVRTRIADGQSMEFIWDHRNRLTKVLVKNAAGTVIRELRNTFDIFDRKIGRWLDADGAGPQAGVQEWTAYDGQNSYMDLNASGAVQKRYLHGDGVDAHFGRLGTAGGAEWYLGDLLWSTRQITSASGMVLDALTYDSYGKTLTETNPAAGDRFKYAAREWESAIDQYYNRARWYDPAPGRFTAADPIGFSAGDANLYRYVGNQPTDRRDPSGLDWLDDYSNFMNNTLGLGGVSNSLGGAIHSGLTGIGVSNQTIAGMTANQALVATTGVVTGVVTLSVFAGLWAGSAMGGMAGIGSTVGSAASSVGTFVTLHSPTIAAAAVHPVTWGVGYAGMAVVVGGVPPSQAGSYFLSGFLANPNAMNWTAGTVSNAYAPARVPANAQVIQVNPSTLAVRVGQNTVWVRTTNGVAQITPFWVQNLTPSLVRATFSAANQQGATSAVLYAQGTNAQTAAMLAQRAASGRLVYGGSVTQLSNGSNPTFVITWTTLPTFP